MGEHKQINLRISEECNRHIEDKKILREENKYLREENKYLKEKLQHYREDKDFELVDDFDDLRN